jgi:hypothetical protein
MASQLSPSEGPRSANLALRTVAGFVVLALAMGLALFGAAGTLLYWQAWLYLLVFLGAATAVTLHLWQADRRLLECPHRLCNSS